MKKLILVLLLIYSFNYTFGQEETSTFSRWYYKPAAGVHIPITNLLSGEVTDNLLQYDDNSFYWQVISVNFFVFKNWGLEFTMQGTNSKKTRGRAERFNTAMQEKYSDDYFVYVSSTSFDDEEGSPFGNIGKVYFGLVYRIEKSKYIFMPKLYLGVASFVTDRGNVTLKEKGTNTVLKLSYNPGTRPNDNFTIAPSFTFGYRISRRFIANVDLTYSYYKTDITFVKELRNTFTNETVVDRIEIKKPIHTLSFGVGFIFEFKPAKNNSKI